MKHTAIDDDGIEREIVTRAEALARGDKVYFTGKRCKHGHLSLRRVNGSCCIVCAKEIARKWHDENSERAKENARKWREKNSDYARKWYRENSERAKEIARKWHDENSDYYRKWYEENAERKKEYIKKWLDENPDYYRKYRQTPKGRAVNRISAIKHYDKYRHIHTHFTPDELATMLALQKERCANPACNKKFKLRYLCKCKDCIGKGKDIFKPEDKERCFHVDHIFPKALALYSQEYLENGEYHYYFKDLQLLCPSCNLDKKTKDNLDYLQQKERKRIKVLI